MTAQERKAIERLYSDSESMRSQVKHEKRFYDGYIHGVRQTLVTLGYTWVELEELRTARIEEEI